MRNLVLVEMYRYTKKANGVYRKCTGANPLNHLRQNILFSQRFTQLLNLGLVFNANGVYRYN